MGEDAETEQAEALLSELRKRAAATAHHLERAESRRVRTSAHGKAFDRRLKSALRNELSEVHRLIDGLHRRYPQTRQPTWSGSVRAGSRPPG